MVSDSHGTSAPKYAAVFVSNVNRPPIASAGAPQTAVGGALVALDGTGSTDLDAGDPLIRNDRDDRFILIGAVGGGEVPAMASP